MQANNNSKPIIFITGATGLVGGYLVQTLLKEGYTLHALVRDKEKAESQLLNKLSSNNISFSKDSLQFFEGDVLDVVAIEDAMENCTIVIHTAALVSAYPSERWDMIKVNHEGTANVVNIALQKEINYFIHLSSVATIGTTLTNESDETTFLNTDLKHSAYTLSKYLAEKEVYRGMEEGLSAVILNPSFILGVSNSQKSSYAYISKISKGLTWYIDGSINVVDVRDVVKAIILVINQRPVNKRYILTSAHYSNKLFLNYLQKCFNLPSRQIKVPDFLLLLLPYLAGILSFVVQRKPFISRDMIKMAQAHNPLNAQKFKSEFSFVFYDMEETATFLRHEFFNK